ncbi:MAG TPA: hypothetical protein VMB71_02600 [Acetobacteraceae bacterium]|nr:hypothetical protein [Acetobacteraceae bacterium]
MQQTIVSVVLPVSADKAAALQDAIDALRAKLTPNPAAPDDFVLLRENLPTLHFMSLLVFGPRAGVGAGDADVSPLFVMEANFDGLPGPFWAELEAQIGPDLRDLLRLCAAPRGSVDRMFDAITAPGSRAPIAPLLDRQSVFPEASHAGVRGLGRNRILWHNALFQAAEAALPPPDEVLSEGAAAIHAWLRARLLPAFPWLDQPYERPFTAAEQTAATRHLVLFGVAALVVAALPWVGLALLFGRPHGHLAADLATLAFLTGAVCMTAMTDIGDLPTLAGRKSMPDLWWQVGGGLLLLAVVPGFLVRGFGAWWLLVPAGIIASALLLVAALRTREKRDPVPADSVPDPAEVLALQDFEDVHVAGADHMASVVIIKGGWLRGFILRFAMRALYALLRATAADGYLGSMRTIHFAHWGIVDGGKRLLFLSNFDGSWESYLDDFIEKAHAGLTLAWGNCLGFPPPRYCALDGATQGRKFKNWARCSMTQSRFWYAAYPNLTVNQIWRQARVVQGLSAPSLSAEQALIWAKDL